MAPENSPEPHDAALAVLGYLNLSSGRADAGFRSRVNGLFAGWPKAPRIPSAAAEPNWRRVLQFLRETLAASEPASGGASQFEQARAVLAHVESLIAAYREFHRDLLADVDLDEDDLFGPFVFARFCEAVLAQGGPWSESARIVAGALDEVNDFVGYRPVPILEHGRHTEPYFHEWVCPIPLYWSEVGVAGGRYHDLIEATWKILAATDKEVLAEAQFDPQRVDEIALDPRAYDFDHPANNRPNHQFAEWDPHRVDKSGHYSRLVLRRVTVDALLARVEDAAAHDRASPLAEAAAVLAGTMLMASGVAGWGPGAHSSDVTLSKLVPRIARYRDEFYARLAASWPGAEGIRLRDEAKHLRQPLAGARQDLNRRLAAIRARQLESMALAHVLADMGYLEAAIARAREVAVASTRMRTEITARLARADLLTARGDVAGAAARIEEAEQELKRAIQCGAVVDPWNILGFQGQFSLFPAVENSIHDERVDALLETVDRLLAASVRLVAEAAARGEAQEAARGAARLEQFADWWDRFATSEVASLARVSGRDAVTTAKAVSQALGAWHEHGGTAGDVAFWKGHVERLATPTAFAIVVTSLLGKGDLVASMAIMVQWLSNDGDVGLGQRDEHWTALAERWLGRAMNSPPGTAGTTADGNALVGRFFAFAEANAGELWDVPTLSAALGARSADDRWSDAKGPAESLEDELGGDDEFDEEDDDAELFGAAYEGVTYRDTTADGIDADMLEGPSSGQSNEIEPYLRMLAPRLEFLRGMAALWTTWARTAQVTAEQDGPRETIETGLTKMIADRRRLRELLSEVEGLKLTASLGSHADRVEFDRQLRTKHALLMQIVETIAVVSEAARELAASPFLPAAGTTGPLELEPWEAIAVRLERGLRAQSADEVGAAFEELCRELSEKSLLYKPLSHGGSAARVAEARSLMRLIKSLVVDLPQHGRVSETCRLLSVLATRQQAAAVPGSVTEFGDLYLAAFEALAEVVVDAILRSRRDGGDEDRDTLEVVDGLELVAEALAGIWMRHAQMVRLSIVEGVSDSEAWERLVNFIGRYGRDFLSVQFLNAGNLRSILSQGVARWLEGLANHEESQDWLLVQELGGPISYEEAARHIRTIAEATLANLPEYADYKATTTQSDQGEAFYTFVDFLRLKGSYARVAWALQPTVVAHDVLARRGLWDAAAEWRERLAAVSQEVADAHERMLAELESRHRMRLRSVADRIAGRFTRPLEVDRMRSLVREAVAECDTDPHGTALATLEEAIAELTAEPTGSGQEVPAWIVALEEEAVAARAELDEPGEANERYGATATLVWSDLERQLREWIEDQ